MEIHDQMIYQKNLEMNPMRATELLHKFLKKSAPQVHSKRIVALINAVKSLLTGKRLTLTGIGRSMNGLCSPKSAIRKIDKLLGNVHLHKERKIYYAAISAKILSGIKCPAISVDWTAAPHHRNYCLRASMNIKGRSMVLYDEVHEQKYEKNIKVNNKFLCNLKNILPDGTTPIIITDAGFRCPWFKQVIELGWDYLGRVRNRNSYFDLASNYWDSTYNLYKKAKNKIIYVGEVLLTKSSKIRCNMYMFRGNIKGRKHYNKDRKKISKRTESKVHSKSHRDPLLVVTSLDSKQYTAKQIINLYGRRMEIEEDFRDVKDPRYGFGLRYSGTKTAARLQVLLLIAALATFVCWIVALTLRRKKEHYIYQANTIKNTTVLSVTYLACEAYRRLGDKLMIMKEDILKSLSEIRDYCLGAAYV